MFEDVLILKKGGIHIKKKNRGSFTRWCKGKVTEECIRRGKNSSNPAIRKKATFAANARRWKHESGGILKAQEGTGNLYAPHPLSPVGIALNQAKAMVKMKGERQHLPPGVKEVVGPDGKKVAIRTEQPLVPLEQSIAEWLPGTGDVAEVGYIADDVKNGNLGSATLGAGLLLLPGNAGKLLKTNVGKKISNFLNKDLFNYDALKIKLQNPHLKRYYHGSPYDFDIENFHKGTTYDMGLHASDRRKVAEYFSEGKGPVFEFFAPKPSAEIMDWHANDIGLFVGNKKFSGGDLNIHDGTESSKLLFNSLRKYGGDDVIEFIPKTDSRVSSLYDVKSFKPFTLKRDVILDGSLVHKLDIPASEYDKLRQLYKDYPLRDEFTISFTDEQATRRAKINSEAATILSDNGYPVFKYENTVPNEGGGTSYMILDPSKIKLVDPKKTVKMKHMLTGLGAGLGVGYGVSQVKDK